MVKKNKKSNKTLLKMARLAHGKGLPRPAYQSKEAAGLDLVAAVAAKKPIRLKSGARALIPTGLCFELPKGFEAQIRPRSGLALKHGITVLNSPGTIDSDYRGEVQVILINLGTATFTVRRGERIAQMVIAPVVQAKIKSSKKLAKTQRGKEGFGSTGHGAAEPKKKTEKRKKVSPTARAKAKKKSKTKSKTPTAKPTRRISKTTSRIAAKSKTRAPVKRKAAASAKRKPARQTRSRTGTTAGKARARIKRTKK